MNRSRSHTVVAGVCMVLTVAFAAAPAAAEQLKPPAAPAPAQPAGAVPGGFATWGDLFAMQDRLNAAATRIVGARGAGYAGVVAAPASRRLNVYWKGPVPQAIRDLSGRLGVPVTFTAARSCWVRAVDGRWPASSCSFLCRSPC